MELVKTKQLADALGLSKKTLLEKARNGGWAYVQKGNSMCFVENRLPTDVRLRLPLTKADQWLRYRSEMLWQKLLRAEGTIRETHS